jgi:hypothetical protein
MAAHLSQASGVRCSQRGGQDYFNLGEEVYNVIEGHPANLPCAPAQTVWDEHGYDRFDPMKRCDVHA